MLIAFNKPYGVHCQFSGGDGRRTLADFVAVPAVYPAGRLDAESEGLVLLTDHGRLQRRITDPRHKWPKTYLVQVEREPRDVALERLRRGLMLNDGLTRPAVVDAIEAPALWDREPPIRVRRTVPTAWLRLVLREGRNHQVRRMTAAIGHPTLRLVRWAIGPYSIEDLAPGSWRAVDPPSEF